MSLLVERPRDILYASFLFTYVAGFGVLVGLFGGGWLNAVQALATFFFSGLLGWFYYSFLMGHVRPALLATNYDDQQGFRQALFMGLVVGPILLWMCSLFYVLDVAEVQMATSGMLFVGWMGFMLSFLAEIHNKYHLFALPVTFLFPDLGAWTYRIRWAKRGDDDKRTDQLLEWSSLAHIRQHPATAPILVQESGPHALERMIWDGRHQDRKPALRRLRKKFPGRARKIIDELPAKALASLGGKYVQKLLQDPSPTIRQKATRAAGFLEVLST